MTRELPAPWQALVAVTGFCLLLSLAWLSTEAGPARFESSATLRLDGHSYRLPLSRIAALEASSRQHFQQHSEASREQLEQQLATTLDALFAEAHARVPDLGDWYYSLAGEYTRLLLPMLLRGGVVAADHLAEQSERILFGEELLQGRLEGMRSDLEQQLWQDFANSHQLWRQDLLAAVDGIHPEPDRSGMVELDLDRLAARVFSHDDPAFRQRMGVSSSAAAGVLAGPLIWQAVSRRAAASSTAMASRGASRWAGRSGGAAAAGAVTCAPGGPAALGCALLAGTLAWIGTDWLLLRVDETRHRAEMEADLHAALSATRAELEAELGAHYARIARHRLQFLHAEIEYSFIPAYHRSPRSSATDPT